MMPERTVREPVLKPEWLDGLTHKDWLIDGYPIRSPRMLEMWNDLDWSQAWVDMGPSFAGNPGPYWHVPLKSDDTVHRLYPKLLRTKWLAVVRQAVEESVARVGTEYLQEQNRELRAEAISLGFKLSAAHRAGATRAACLEE